ncbi:MAG: MBL fold metallo-hydrolase [Oscillospiraceae bacterium]|nr:MBL fold metallo-hydrolase [Oscillospiraceae bacterium]
MKVDTLRLGELAANCHIIDCGEGICAAVDVGNDAEKLLSFLKSKNLTLGAILLTHGHYDHIGGVEEVRKATGATVYIHENDARMLEDAKLNLAAHITPLPYNQVTEYTAIQDGVEITVGSRIFKVLHTPGHTSGSVCYLTEDVMLSGDTLFCGSIGRTDLGGDPAQMKESLRRLKALQKNYRVYTGHDYSTTLDEERMSNPYMRNL